MHGPKFIHKEKALDGGAFHQKPSVRRLFGASWELTLVSAIYSGSQPAHGNRNKSLSYSPMPMPFILPKQAEESFARLYDR
eukprot:1774575-Amphidinium_carterae.1